MKFGKRLTELRKKKGFSQEELAKKVKIHPNIIGRYERGETMPALDVSFKLADVLEVSLDYLTCKTDMLVDKSILDKLMTIQKMPDADREHILFALDAMLRDTKARLAYNS
jgi:transcriptional regulator with XRE-family HTH domain